MKIVTIVLSGLVLFSPVYAEENIFSTMTGNKNGSVEITDGELGKVYDFSRYSMVTFPYEPIANAKSGELSFRVKIKYDPATDERMKAELRNQIFFSIVQGRRRFDISNDLNYLVISLFDSSPDVQFKSVNKRLKRKWVQDEWVPFSMKWGKEWVISMDGTDITVDVEGLYPVDATNKFTPKIILGSDQNVLDLMSEFVIDQLKIKIDPGT